MSSARTTIAARAGTVHAATLARAGRWVGACAALSLLLWRFYGTPAIGYDTFYALTWGGELANGELPKYEVVHGPTPHPLANLVAALLSPLGPHSAMVAVRAISIVGLAVLGIVCFALGRSLYSLAVGIVFAALVLTRPILVAASLDSTIDLPFLCLSLGALLLAVARPSDRYGVLALLGAAGLLRPEAWAFSAVFTAWRWPASTPRERGLMAGLTAVAPGLWIASDAIITGQPAYSFSRTRMIAEHTGERGGVVETFSWAARSSKGILHAVPAVAAVGGLLAGLRYLRARTLPPAVLLALGSVSFFATGFSGLPLLIRYFLLPGAVLCLFAAVGLFGWHNVRPGTPVRTWWARAAAVGFLLVAVAIAPDAAALRRAAERHRDASAVQRKLEQLVRTPAARAALGRCSPLQTRDYRARPELLYIWHDRTPEPEIVATSDLVVGDGLLLRNAGERFPASAPGFKVVVSNSSWTLLERCASRRGTAARVG